MILTNPVGEGKANLSSQVSFGPNPAVQLLQLLSLLNFESSY
jgi:hypothetical protein